MFCRFCQSAEHLSAKCTKYITPESRIAALRSRHGSNVCQKCTQNHTGACKKRYWGYCNMQKSCKEYPHNYHVCPIRCKQLTTVSTNPVVVETVVAHPVCNANVLEKPSYTKAESCETKNSHDTNDPNNIGGLYVTNKRKRSVALETATFTAFNDSCSYLPIHERGVNALLDTGAQRSMVTAATVERLGLETVERDAATLQGFGNLRPINKIYDIVRVNLGKVDFKPISVLAIVVKNLNAILMIRACAMGKRLAKYTKLADFRLLNGKSDTFAVDILIGNDFRNKSISKTIRPKQICGMWVESTIWGNSILSGPILGSQGLLDENQSANVIMVCAVLNTPPYNDVNLQSVTREKGLNDIKDSLLCIPITQGQTIITL